MAILCFCPPDNCEPFSPTKVSKPFGNKFLSKIKSDFEIFITFSKNDLS